MGYRMAMLILMLYFFIITKCELTEIISLQKQSHNMQDNSIDALDSTTRQLKEIRGELKSLRYAAESAFEKEAPPPMIIEIPKEETYSPAPEDCYCEDRFNFDLPWTEYPILDDEESF